MNKKDQDNLAKLVFEMYDSGTINPKYEISDAEEQEAVGVIRSKILPKKVEEWNNAIEYSNKDRLSRLSRFWRSKRPTSLQEVEKNLVRVGDKVKYQERHIQYMVDLRSQNSILLDMTISKDGNGALGVTVSNFGSTGGVFYRIS